MFAEDLISLLVDAGLGVYETSARTIFKGSKAVIPAGDGPFISIVETGGSTSEGTHNLTTVPAYVKPSAQLIFRATNYDDAMALAQRAYELLYPVRNRKVNGTWWRSVTIVQEPFDLGLDDKERARIAFNINVVKRLSPATS